MDSVTYGLRHVFFLMISSLAGWLITVELTIWILGPTPFRFVYSLFWGIIFFIFTCIILIRMSWEMKITVWNVCFTFIITAAVICLLPYMISLFE